MISQDLERIASTTSVPWRSLHGTSVLVTGATGLIGATLVKALLWYGLRADADLRVHALVQDAERARARFSAPLAAGARLSFVQGDVRALPPVAEHLDLVVHGASLTASRDFVARPVDTISTTLQGTQQVLELAREHGVRSLVYLSSMEVYGSPRGGSKVTEADLTGFDPVQVRSSYPESKRMAEALCAAYAAQHGVPAKVARLTQTFGPGVSGDDERVFADFARRSLRGEDLVLHTAGDSERSYVYTADAVTALLTVLLLGEDGQAYNVANESTYCSIRDMADLVARTCGPSPVGVRIEPQDLAVFGYAPSVKVDLDTAKLQALGWRPTVGLAEMYRRMVAVF